MIFKFILRSTLLIIALISCLTLNGFSQSNLKLDKVFYLEINSNEFTKVDVPTDKVWQVKSFLYSADKNAPNKDRTNVISTLIIKYKEIEFRGISSSNYRPHYLASGESVSFKVLPFKEYECEGLLTIFEYSIE